MVRQFLLPNKFKDLKVNLESKALKEAANQAKADKKALKVGMTFPGGTHDLWMRYWLAAGGINPDQDVVLERRTTTTNGSKYESRNY